MGEGAWWAWLLGQLCPESEQEAAECDVHIKSMWVGRRSSAGFSRPWIPLFCIIFLMGLTGVCWWVSPQWRCPAGLGSENPLSASSRPWGLRIWTIQQVYVVYLLWFRLWARVWGSNCEWDSVPTRNLVGERVGIRGLSCRVVTANHGVGEHRAGP